MYKFNENDLQLFISKSVISPFYETRQSKLEKLQLVSVLKRKNPYLFKAKNIQTSEELVKYILDAFLSSQEETIFGNLMEKLAIYVCEKALGGKKAEEGKFKSIDLIFRKNNKMYIVGIKSGPFWGNKDQKDRMKSNFKKAREILRQEGVDDEIIAVNGCIYGKDNRPYKEDPDVEKSYFKFCGQEFWELITGDSEFYQRIIIPIDKEAKRRDESFRDTYYSKTNELTKDFALNYLTEDGMIDWVKIIDFVSRKNGQ